LDDFFVLRTVEEARKAFLSAWLDAGRGFLPALLPQSDAELLLASGRVLAKDIVASEDVPPHPRSTVDGYAVAAADTYGATESLPAMLNIVEDIAMGAMPTARLSRGQASRIPTGGMLPKGADACIMVEHTDLLDADTVLVHRPAAAGENVVQQGEDVREGQTVLGAGRVLTPFDLGALAALGFPRVPVVERPVVAVISSGDEIVPPDEMPLPGQVRDINTYSLSAALAGFGARPLALGIARDSYESLRALVEKGLGCADAVVVSGGSSVGTRDVAVQVFGDLGPPGVIVHGVAVKPGKPVILAICRGKPVFGLPGHPVSALVSLDLFVRYALNALTAASAGGLDLAGQLSSAQETWVQARLGRNVSSTPGREDHVRVQLVEKDGMLVAQPVLGKSGLISTMVRSDGEVVIPQDMEGLMEGSQVAVRLPRF
jgi:molybdopterin molybdotransferase